jgi:hypothetical protein
VYAGPRVRVRRGRIGKLPAIKYSQFECLWGRPHVRGRKAAVGGAPYLSREHRGPPGKWSGMPGNISYESLPEYRETHTGIVGEVGWGKLTEGRDGQRRCHRVERPELPLIFRPEPLYAWNASISSSLFAKTSLQSITLPSPCQTTRMKWMWMHPPRCNSHPTMPVGRRERRPTSPSQPRTICHGMPGISIQAVRS